jgi:hypothetical protein
MLYYSLCMRVKTYHGSRTNHPPKFTPLTTAFAPAANVIADSAPMLCINISSATRVYAKISV